MNFVDPIEFRVSTGFHFRDKFSAESVFGAVSCFKLGRPVAILRYPLPYRRLPLPFSSDLAAAALRSDLSPSLPPPSVLHFYHRSQDERPLTGSLHAAARSRPSGRDGEPRATGGGAGSTRYVLLLLLSSGAPGPRCRCSPVGERGVRGGEERGGLIRRGSDERALIFTVRPPTCRREKQLSHPRTAGPPALARSSPAR